MSIAFAYEGNRRERKTKYGNKGAARARPVQCPRLLRSHLFIGAVWKNAPEKMGNVDPAMEREISRDAISNGFDLDAAVAAAKRRKGFNTLGISWT
ncbi:hypothetical protein AB4Z43_28870 [Mesorhizobium sp. 2RAF45]|uniref:hypothetical protein n=1 Tax=Mesorhizobium sp. 2RAF45 TaxID=3233001 RepID=UPI003F9D6C8E